MITCRSHNNGYEYLASSSQEDQEIEPIDLFLNSVLNVELVYIILRAITDMARVSDIAISSSQENVSKEPDLANLKILKGGDAVLTLNEIKVFNPDMWEHTCIMNFLRKTVETSTSLDMVAG